MNSTSELVNLHTMDLNFTNKSEEYRTQAMAKHLIANVVVLSLYLVIGVIGNMIVLAVYRFQMKGKEERYFIPFLAVSDMLTSVVGSVNCIMLDVMQTTFTNNILCKIVFYTIALTAGISLFLLLSIAIQRYLIICRRHRLNLNTRKIMVTVSVCLSVACSVPFAVNYGVNEHFSEGRLIGYRCGRLKHGFYQSGLVYSIFFITLMLFTVLALVFLYGRVGWVIFKHFNAQKFKQTNISKETSTGDKLTNETIATNIQSKTQELKNPNGSYSKLTVNSESKNDSNVESTQSSDVYTETTVPECSSSAAKSGNSIQPKRLKKTNRSKKRRRFKNKFTFMFILITAVSIVCYMPVGMVVLLEGILPDFWERLSETVAATVLWLYHTYIINSIVNPIIYAFMDAEFSTALKALFGKCKCSTKFSK
ncbi:mu-type opioid receptor-like [Mytilus trossulus]|uniref:mu-type opioid receptor-like n=1 Tax=Mytilus trossulus TaxID=6551 RepID=UPI0030061B63